MQRSSKILVYIQPTTHWDREWVMTQEQYQVRLADLFERLLKICRCHPEYRFYFDGQLLPFEDYLEIHPERRTELLERCALGQLVVGPWYSLADLFLASGESLLRNLLYGHKLCREFRARPLPLGYNPDSFGSAAGLPMLLREFNIPYANFGRSRSPSRQAVPTNEFRWTSRSGAEVLASNHVYATGLFLSYPRIDVDIFHDHPLLPAIAGVFEHELAEQGKDAAAGCRCFSVGIDHMEPRAPLLRTMKYINSRQSRYTLRLGTLVDYLREVEKECGKKLPVYCGEQYGTPEAPEPLSGTLSSMPTIKQRNFRCEKWLTALLEPLAVLAAKHALRPYPAGFLDKLWKKVLASHAHDSICGCSVDAVNRTVCARLEAVEDCAKYQIKDTLQALVGGMDTSAFAGCLATISCFTPLSPAQDAPVRQIVSFPRRMPHEGLSLVAASGQGIPAQFRWIADKRKDLESVYMMPEQLALVLSKNAGPDGPDDAVFSVFEVTFVANSQPMCGWQTFGVKAAPSRPAADLKRLGALAAENRHFRFEMQPDGAVTVTDKRTGHAYPGLLHFEDRLEQGDAYRHITAPGVKSLSSLDKPGTAECAEETPACISFRAKFELGTGVRLTVTWSVWAELPYLPVKIDIDNQRPDHCLEAVFASSLPIEKVWSESAFDPVAHSMQTAELMWRHFPMQQWAAMANADGGLAVLAKGLYSHLGARDANGNAFLLVTLLRCSGKLGAPAGANYPTSETQEIGAHSFDLAILPLTNDSELAQCPRFAAEFCNPIAIYGGSAQKGRLPADGSLINISGDSPVVVTAIKRSEDGRGTVVRCHNCSAQPVASALRGLLPESAWCRRVQANEQTRFDHVDPDCWTIPPYALETLQFGHG